MIEHKWMILTLLKRYKNTADMIGNTVCEDLIQEGWLAIAKKIDGYDSKRATLSTYLFPWIEDAFRQYLRKSTVVRKKRGKTNLKISHYMLESIEYDDFKADRAPSPECIYGGMQQAEIAVDKYLRQTRRSKPSQKYLEIRELSLD